MTESVKKENNLAGSLNSRVSEVGKMSEVGNDNAVSPAEVFFYSVSKGDEVMQPPESLFAKEEMTQLSEDQI